MAGLTVDSESMVEVVSKQFNLPRKRVVKALISEFPELHELKEDFELTSIMLYHLADQISITLGKDTSPKAHGPWEGTSQAYQA